MRWISMAHCDMPGFIKIPSQHSPPLNSLLLQINMQNSVTALKENVVYSHDSKRKGNVCAFWSAG